jgi:hypothetical protein
MKFLKDIFRDVDGIASSKRVIAMIFTLLFTVNFLVNLFTGKQVAPTILEFTFYLIVAGGLNIASEKFTKRKPITEILEEDDKK